MQRFEGRAVIVYTANYGDKDKLVTPRVTTSWDKDLRFVYFTDHPFESDVWDVVVEEKHGVSNRVAKWFKLHPHELFPGEPTLWIDATITVWKDPTRFLQGWEDILLRTHPKRNDIYEEADICIQASRDAVAVKEQVAEYRRQGCPKEAGLYINGTLFRKPTALTAELNRVWWRQIERYSYRDQISLPYVLWAQGLSFKEVAPDHFGDTFSPPRRHKFRGSKELT